MKERVKMKKTRQKINSRMKKNWLIKRTKGIMLLNKCEAEETGDEMMEE